MEWILFLADILKGLPLEATVYLHTARYRDAHKFGLIAATYDKLIYGREPSVLDNDDQWQEQYENGWYYPWEDEEPYEYDYHSFGALVCRGQCLSQPAQDVTLTKHRCQNSSSTD